MVTLLIPSKGRPEKAREALESADGAAGNPDTEIIVAVDNDDLAAYAGVIPAPNLVAVNHDGSGMAGALNRAVEYAASFYEVGIIGFMGDDHRVRTEDWDRIVEQANAEMGGGIVYGNDLIHGERLPSAVFMDARIVLALGWMALPGAKHLYLDDTWRELGAAMGRLKYLPDMVIEHLHPTVGKAEWDDNYRRVNASAVYEHDAAIYNRWFAEQREADAAKALAALR